MSKKDDFEEYEVKNEVYKEWSLTLKYFLALYKRKNAFTLSKAKQGGYESGASTIDHTPSSNTSSITSVLESIASTSTRSTIVSNLEMPYKADNYIASLEEELAATKEKAAGNLIDPIFQLIEELRLQRKQTEDFLKKLAATATPTLNPTTLANLCKGLGRYKDMM